MAPAKKRQRSKTRSAQTGLERALDLFRQWGREGGKKRARMLSDEARREISRKASRARWGKRKAT